MRMDGRQIGEHTEQLIACVTRCTFL